MPSETSSSQRPIGSVHLCRTVSFSSGHRYWSSRLTPEENRLRFGEWASPYNHGHNYQLDVTLAGQIDPTNGMVVNIKTLDALLQSRIVARFNQRSINDEVAEFADTSPTTENLLLFFRETLTTGPGIVELDGQAFTLIELKLIETPRLWGTLQGTSMELQLTRSYEFAASHRLHNPALTHEQNIELYGKCNNRMGHGHNYVLEVTVVGTPDPSTGMLADLGSIDEVVERLVVNRYDHKNLNEDVGEFADKVPTSEWVVAEIFDRLNGQLPARLVKVRLLETARNAFEVWAPQPVEAAVLVGANGLG